MAEYIEREKLIRYTEKQKVIIKDGTSLADAIRIQGNVFRRCVETCPADDVAPKSEYNAVVSAVDNSTKEFLKLHDEYQDAKREIADLQDKLEQAKAEVAREIFEKIDRFIKANCLEIKDERGIKGYATSGVHFAIADLKKKYTEGEK